MAKRKGDSDANRHSNYSKQAQKSATQKAEFATTAIQIITGAYEKTLHGIVALIPRNKSTDDSDAVKFFDNFLFDAHSSVVRCLALSPISKSTRSDASSLILASGGLDEKINLFQLSASSPTELFTKKLPESLAKGPLVRQKVANREIGSLLHHSSGITKLSFPNRKKLLSAAGDNVIAISRTQDWTLLSSIKAPIPVPSGRPSGDTVSLGDSPAGFNDFAVHPSLKLMISVGKGEKCMRLWNLITGKKAGVLSFETTLLRQVGEGKRSSGEGRKIVWEPEGDAFVVGFERGAALFGMESVPKLLILPSPSTKIHQISYVKRKPAEPAALALSTEDSRVLFYSPSLLDSPTTGEERSILPICQPFAQLGGRAAGVQGRIKDFECLSIPVNGGDPAYYVLITCGSDGVVSLWRIENQELTSTEPAGQPNDTFPQPNGASEETNEEGANETMKDQNAPARQIGKLLGSYETNERITCLKAFAMHDAGAVPRASEEEAELDFDASYPDDTPKSDLGDDVTASEDSGEES